MPQRLALEENRGSRGHDDLRGSQHLAVAEDEALLELLEHHVGSLAAQGELESIS